MTYNIATRKSLTYCSKIHLCHFVGVTMLCSFPTFLCTCLDGILPFTNVHGAMYYIPHSLTVLRLCKLYNHRGCLTKLLRTNHEDRIVPVVSGGGPVPADLPLCLLHW